MPSRSQPSTYGRSGGTGRARQTRPPAGSDGSAEVLEAGGLPAHEDVLEAGRLPANEEAGGLPGDTDNAQEPKEPKDPKELKAPEAAARQICLRLLTLAPRTRAQLADALQRRHIPGPAAEAVLDRFTEAGLIDDPAFARAWVESRHHGRGLSRRALSTELRRRGVADEDVQEAVELVGPDQEVATARQLIAGRVAATRDQPSATRVRKLMGALARKGYGTALAYRVVREALEAEGPEGAELAGELSEPDPDVCSEDASW